jgi:tRNA (guanine37-N1)-methyltransferase
MVLKVDILDRALQSIPIKHSTTSRKILLDPQGAPYNQHAAKRISTYDHVIFVCGHYEGIDERARSLVDEELSIGDYILTGGEPAALVVIDSIVRLIPGVLAKKEATIHESFEQNLLEYPQYTRPEEYNGEKVPQILLSGDHERIDKWRNEQAVLRTKTRRPDLLTEQKDSL